MSSQKTPDSDGDSDSTLDALDALDTRWTFGYPLERLGLVHQLDEEKDWISSLRELCSCSSPNSDGDNESVSSSVIYDMCV
jgi:hypothetical protein